MHKRQLEDLFNAINNSSNRSLADAACSCGMELEINYMSHRFRLSSVQLRNQPQKIWHRQNCGCFFRKGNDKVSI